MFSETYSLCAWVFCLHICLCTRCMHCWQRLEGDIRVPKIGITFSFFGIMWVLGIRPGSSGRASSALNPDVFLATVSAWTCSSLIWAGCLANTLQDPTYLSPLPRFSTVLDKYLHIWLPRECRELQLSSLWAVGILKTKPSPCPCTIRCSPGWPTWCFSLPVTLT